MATHTWVPSEETAVGDLIPSPEITYELPYLAHAPMEPNNAACVMSDDGFLEVWAGTEGPEYTRMAASAAAGIGKDRVRVHVPYAGGSFGLHSTSGHDPTSEAVQVARALDWKYPVKLQSPREEEFKSGRYRAMAVHRIRAGADAQVTEVSRDERNRVCIEKITFALDCGVIVNPDLVRAQVEGGLIFALGAAAWGEVVLGDGGQIVTQSFDRYQVMRMQSVPRIDVLLIESAEPPTGVGEVSVPTAAPALANAIFALTGTRIRRLPIAKTIRIV